MIGMTIALIAIPLSIGVVLSVIGTQFVRAATDRHRSQKELFVVGVGLIAGGGTGFIGSGTVAFVTGLVPLFGTGHPVAASAVIAAGTLAGAPLGAWVGQILSMRMVKKSV
jgi:uncharacterized membrane protein YfcA